MWRRVRKWFADNREWNRRHREAWSGATSPRLTLGGLSPFQDNCERVFLETLKGAGLTVTERMVQPFEKDEVTIYMRVEPGNLDVWIGSDGAQFGHATADVRLEEWDALTPDDLISEFVAGAIKEARSLR